MTDFLDRLRLPDWVIEVSEVPEFIGGVINLAYSFAAVVATAFIIYAGYLWMASTGDPEKLRRAQQTLFYAVVGLIVVIISGLIVKFIGELLGIGDYIFDLHLPRV